jgi:uncharacterized membrane protein (TIGR02234 family)
MVPDPGATADSGRTADSGPAADSGRTADSGRAADSGATAGVPGGGTGAARTGGRRLLAYTVGCCLGGAGLALFAVTRVWSVEVTARAGLSDLRTARTGAAQLPWLPAVALVALAGAGALLATRGVARRVLGALLALAGIGMSAGAVTGRAGLDAGAAGAGATFWPIVCAAGGLAVTLGGWWALRHGHRWPAMGARYERPAPPQVGQPGDQARAPDPADTSSAVGRPVDTRVAWDALDRGEDPTVS